ncbi:AI-2E family transporter [Timonella senegalensis]|uniref:AI-2E family transporter n=1 Tax=Timonella senegalensis TaxID=1465825 RepID=UPI000302EB5B|nr:AI-2E family transporter [Timonella senegalensis]
MKFFDRFKSARPTSGEASTSHHHGPNRGVEDTRDEELNQAVNALYSDEQAHEVHFYDLPDWYRAARPPRWMKRALIMSVATVFIGIFIWRAMGSLTGLFINLVIALFLALAMEPIILWLVRKGWRRGAATIATLIGLLLLVGAILTLFGGMFIDQAGQLISSLPDTYDSVATWIEKRIDINIPEMSELQRQLINDYGGDAANQALAIGASLLGVLFNTSVVLLVAYYLAAAGPRFRASICAWLSPARQTEVLRLWDITQRKISDYINSRVVLAFISSVCTAIFLQIIGIPYALPLAVFTGVVSQFVPTIGTYIGGALPIIFALTNGDMFGALGILIFIVLYQQFENLLLAPKISARALSLNPAVSFIVVLAFGAVFGALGAFLALPIAATIQAISSTYLRRHELIDSEMLRDPLSARSSANPSENDEQDGVGDAEKSED